MDFQTEALRMVRYGIGPVVGFLVGKGILPADLQGPLVDFLSVAAGSAVPFIWSVFRDKKKWSGL